MPIDAKGRVDSAARPLSLTAMVPELMLSALAGFASIGVVIHVIERWRGAEGWLASLGVFGDLFAGMAAATSIALLVHYQLRALREREIRELVRIADNIEFFVFVPPQYSRSEFEEVDRDPFGVGRRGASLRALVSDIQFTNSVDVQTEYDSSRKNYNVSGEKLSNCINILFQIKEIERNSDSRAVELWKSDDERDETIKLLTAFQEERKEEQDLWRNATRKLFLLLADNNDRELYKLVEELALLGVFPDWDPEYGVVTLYNDCRYHTGATVIVTQINNKAQLKNCLSSAKARLDAQTCRI
jgi:hypothetical protein